MTGVKRGDRVKVDGGGTHLVLGQAHYAGAWWVTGKNRPVEAKRMQLAEAR